MAVEIPVVIDIDKAFDDAIKKLPSAMRPLKNTIEQLSQELNVARQLMAEAPIDSQDWKDATKWVQGLAQSLDVANDKMRRLSANDGSIKQLTADLASVNRRWEEMGSAQKFTARGALTAEAKELYNEYKRIAKALDKNASLTSRWAAEQDKLAKRAQATRDNKLMMSAPANTLNELRKQESLLSAAMGQVAIGSTAFKDYETRLTDVRAKIKSATSEQKTYNTELSKSHSRLGTLIKSTAAYFALHQVTNFLRNIRAVTAEFEMQRVALGGIIQDSDKASELFKQIKAAAIKSPFEIKDLVSYTKQLSAYRIETDQLFETTQRLADISSGLGVDMGRIILAYGQVRAASVLRGQELRQFTEAGIPLVELLADKFTQLSGRMVNTAEVFDLISKRAVSFKMVKEIFEDMTNAGGIFYKMQEKQSETLQGQWMNLKDSVAIMYDEIGNTKAVHNAMEFMISSAKSLMDNWQTVSKVLGGVIASMTAYKVAVIASSMATKALTAAKLAELKIEWQKQVGISKTITLIFGETAAKKVQIALSNAYVAAKTREAAATNLFTKAFYKMTAALLKNPYALAIAGITALGYGLYQLMTNAKKAKISIEDFGESLESFKQFASHAQDIENLCAVYDGLNKITNKTVEEQKSLKRSAKELAAAYPAAVMGVDAQTGALKLNTKEIKNNNDAVREAIELSFLKDKTTAEEELAKLEAERDRIENILEKGKQEKVVGRYGGSVEVPLTENDKAYYGARIRELEPKIEQFTKLIQDAKDQYEELERRKFVGPQKIEFPFLDDAWRMSLVEYAYTMESTGQRIRAFTNEQIENFTSLKDALDDAAKGYKEQKEAVEFYQHAYGAATGGKKEQMGAALADAKAQLAMYTKILTDNNAMYLTASNGSGGTTKDSFILLMQNRIKFMKDFQKGYESLLKFMSASSALQKEGSIMQGRGVALGIDPAEQKRAATDLSGWFEDLKKTVFAEAQKKGAKGDVLDFLGLKIDSGVLREYQSLIQSIFDAKTDIDTSQMSKNLDKAIKQLSTELKNSEAARNFYKDILGQTGDEQLATTLTVSVYGDIGKDFKDRIQSQLDKAFASLSEADQTPEMKAAIDTQDFGYILSNLDKFSQEWQKVLQNVASDSTQYKKQILGDFAKLVSEYGTTQQKIAIITDTTKKKIQDVESARDTALSDKSLSQEARDRIIKEADSVIAALKGQAELDIFKESEDYVKFFSEINMLTTSEAANVRGKLRQAYIDAFKSGAINADELRKALRAVDEQFKKLNEDTSLFTAYLKGGTDGLIQRFSDYADTLQVIAGKMQRGQGLSKSEEDWVGNITKKFGKKFGGEDLKGIKSYGDLMSKFGNNTQAAGKAMGNLSNAMSSFSSKGGGAIAMVDMIVQAVNDMIVSMQQVIDQLNEMRSEENKFGDGFKYISDFNKYAYSGWQNLKSGNIFGALADTAGSIISIFNNIQRDKVNNLNNTIEYQQEIVENLSSAYNRLEKAMSDSFGSDYVYNYTEQMNNLEQQAIAYEKMAEAERAKGKSSDSDKVSEYMKQADEVRQQMDDMKHQLSEFFTGTDLTSAAKDFAQAWIDAYRSFGSTTTAMKDKFKEMIDNMIVNSVAGQAMQKLLQPIFNAIDDYAKTPEGLAEHIGDINEMMDASYDSINDTMMALMERLTAQGANMRATGSSLSGISKDIAGASEESINALAAGINTQNFYMSYMPNIDRNVAAILVAIQGGSTPNTVATPQATSVQFGDETFRGQMSRIDENVAGIYQMIRSVITPKSANINTHCVGTKS